MSFIFWILFAPAALLLAHPNVFSIYDDLLAFPQYEIVFSESSISDNQASFLISQRSSDPLVSDLSKYTSGSPHQDIENENSSPPPMSTSRESYELLHLQGVPHLCSIPIVGPSSPNNTTERDARAAERQELSRATEKAWELLQGLEGSCLYFVSGWWSYSFCFNSEVIQFHHLTLQPGKQESPKRDPTTKQFILGKAITSKDSRPQSRRQANGLMDMHGGKQIPKLELQYKGGTRYLVQRMDSGTICDLTNKPRKIEIQFYCNPSLTDRIGYIKEVTTCSYMMIVYTSRLCSELEFLPTVENKNHTITCRMVVPEEDLSDKDELKILEAVIQASHLQITKETESPKTVGGILVGGGRWINSENQRMAIPEIFGDDVIENEDKPVEIVTQSKSKGKSGYGDAAPDADEEKMDLHPEMVDALRLELQKMAKERGWKIEIVKAPGETRKVLASVDGKNEEPYGEEDVENEEKETEMPSKDEL
ncbi:Protein OS-9-like protein [Golovinomyces cichoracearum]|uniref:Endoplasmic reticulum lectin n=1 Tax=Golovinomyces cichoracearum TaxID=62708 RepID=A0A420IKS5_9PEZI|nr:Protein OS-9-like protein [Golovinomyces cichoracearum]